MNRKKVIKPVDDKYKDIFKVWNEPKSEYKNSESRSKKGKLIKILLHPLLILAIITFGMVIYTFHLCFGR